MLPRGLERVTLTPGRTAPDGSVTVPPIAPTPCARAGSVEHTENDNTTRLLPTKCLALIVPLPLFGLTGGVSDCEGSDGREHTPAQSALGDAVASADWMDDERARRMSHRERVRTPGGGRTASRVHSWR